MEGREHPALERSNRAWLLGEPGGVAQARVAQEDYEGVKPLLRRVWRGQGWEAGALPDPARVLLGYLRGYFLYREVPGEGPALWRHFLEDLGLEGPDPTPADQGPIREDLAGHEETQPLLEGGQDLVATLEAVFRFRALRLEALKRAFLHFYRTGHLPREARPHGRLFRQLQGIMAYLLEGPGVDLEDEEAVLAALLRAGLLLREPHPVRVLFGRSRQALRELWGEASGRGVWVEVLELPEGLEVEEIQPALSPEPLVEGWRVYGKVVLGDGGFQRFAWRPRLTPEGEPIPEVLEVPLGEGQGVRFRLHHRAWGLGEPLGVGAREISAGVGARAGARTSRISAWTSRPPGALGLSTTRPTHRPWAGLGQGELFSPRYHLHLDPPCGETLRPLPFPLSVFRDPGPRPAFGLP